jgi:hypothetical protein
MRSSRHSRPLPMHSHLTQDAAVVTYVRHQHGLRINAHGQEPRLLARANLRRAATATHTHTT